MRQTTMTQAYPKRQKKDYQEENEDSEDESSDNNPSTALDDDSDGEDQLEFQDSIDTALLPDTAGSPVFFPRYRDGMGTNNKTAIEIGSTEPSEDGSETQLF